MGKLALLGGEPVRREPFPRHPVIGEEEKRAVLDVLERAELSTFIASPGHHFLGGRKVREFEQQLAAYHGVRYAVAFNSATAALHAAVAAVGVQAGEEVIVPPYTFTSTATSVLMHNAIPVFADIQRDIYCLDPGAVEHGVSPLTRAIIVVHLFGHPARLDDLMAVADRHGLKVIEDCAQAPTARYDGRLVGAIGHCGVFSFTESKHVTTGEGGMLITNDEAIAETARLIRNHGEVVWEDRPRTYTSTMLGWNYRMTELEAALGIVQFGRIDALIESRIALCEYLTRRLRAIDAFAVPAVDRNCRHVYYLYALKYDADRAGLPRDLFVQAMAAEGIPLAAGYVRPLYRSPIYREAKPSAFRLYHGSARYDDGICPVAEQLYARELIALQVARPPARLRDMDDVVTAAEKVLAHAPELAGLVADSSKTVPAG